MDEESLALTGAKMDGRGKKGASSLGAQQPIAAERKLPDALVEDEEVAGRTRSKRRVQAAGASTNIAAKRKRGANKRTAEPDSAPVPGDGEAAVAPKRDGTDVECEAPAPEPPHLYLGGSDAAELERSLSHS